MIQCSIDRKALVSRHDPILTEVDVQSPMSVGNGDFCFTADVTGMQTLYREYFDFMPLCTMANWGWHSVPNISGGRYTIDDVVMEKFPYKDREVSFALNMQPGNEEPYTWMRKNPHKYSLGRIALKLDGGEIAQNRITAVRQHLYQYEGKLESSFEIDGIPCRVVSACDPAEDTLAFWVESAALKQGRLTVEILFPYGDHHKAAALWDCPQKHTTSILERQEGSILLARKLDWDEYFVTVTAHSGGMDFSLNAEEHVLSMASRGDACVEFCVAFSPVQQTDFTTVESVFGDARLWWENYWETGAAVRLSKSSHPFAYEMERRIIISQYTLAIQSAGHLPPAETGLTCNSWYGKFHLEMHLWHSAWLALWGHEDMLERTIDWYHEILPKAKWNAQRNGYKGARWPKMIAPAAVDCPSFIATLLVWQQNHILYMLELLYHANDQSSDYLLKHWPLIRETADFLADLPVYNEKTGYYDLTAPMIPSEENETPMDVHNPGFECAYWKWGLKTAIRFAERVGKPVPRQWREVHEKMAPPPMRDGYYIQHEWAKPSKKYPNFKPVPVGIFGLLPGDGIDPQPLREGLADFMKREVKIFIGWTFSYFAMCATRLNMPQTAVEIMSLDHPCNVYFQNGHNAQLFPDPNVAPKDVRLPLYLPGNGALLLVLPLMIMGYPGQAKETPGFPDDGQWVVEVDGLKRFPF